MRRLCTGFKLNLGTVKPNEVTDGKPVAVPHTPKGQVLEGIAAAAAAR